MSNLVQTICWWATSVNKKNDAIELLGAQSKERRGQILSSLGVTWICVNAGLLPALIPFIDEQPEKTQKRIFAAYRSHKKPEEPELAEEIERIKAGQAAVRADPKFSKEITPTLEH